MEAAPAQTIGNEADAADAPSGLREKRRALMASWADYLAQYRVRSIAWRGIDALNGDRRSAGVSAPRER